MSSIKPWQPPLPDEQMIAEARWEDLQRSVVRKERSRDGRSLTAYDRDGKALYLACGVGRRSQMEDDPNLQRQAAAGEESQDPGDGFEGC